MSNLRGPGQFDNLQFSQAEGKTSALDMFRTMSLLKATLVLLALSLHSAHCEEDSDYQEETPLEGQFLTFFLFLQLFYLKNVSGT